MDIHNHLAGLVSQLFNQLLVAGGGVLDGLISSIQNMFPDMIMLIFFKGIIEFVRHEITGIATAGVSNMIGLVAAIAFPIVTIWLLIQGYQIMTGRSQTPLLGFTINAAKVIVIMSFAMSGAVFNDSIQDTIWELRDELASVVSNESGNVYDNIDKSLMLSQAMMILADKLNIETDAAAAGADDSVKTAKWISTFGSAGPAFVGGALTIMHEFALAFCIMFYPLMLVGLLFEQTKQMFWQWLKFTIATMFSAGALAATSALAMKMTAIYGTAILIATWAGMTGSADAQGNATPFIQSAMALGGLGTFLTVLIISVPVVVYNFFAGNLGFSPFNAFTAQGEKTGLSGGKPEEPTVTPPTTDAPRGGNPNAQTEVDASRMFAAQEARHNRKGKTNNEEG